MTKNEQFNYYMRIANKMTKNIISKNKQDIKQDIYIEIWKYLINTTNTDKNKIDIDIIKIIKHTIKNKLKFYKKEYGDCELLLL